MDNLNEFIIQEWSQRIQNQYLGSSHIDNEFNDALQEIVTEIKAQFAKFDSKPEIADLFRDVVTLAIHSNNMNKRLDGQAPTSSFKRASHFTADQLRDPNFVAGYILERQTTAESICEIDRFSKQPEWSTRIPYPQVKTVLPISKASSMDRVFVAKLQLRFQGEFYAARLEKGNLGSDDWHTALYRRITVMLFSAYNESGVSNLRQILNQLSTRQPSLEVQARHVADTSSYPREQLLFSLISHCDKGIQAINTTNMVLGLQVWVSLAYLGMEYKYWTLHWRDDDELRDCLKKYKYTNIARGDTLIRNMIQSRLHGVGGEIDRDSLTYCLKVATAVSRMVNLFGWIIVFLLPANSSTLKLLDRSPFDLLEMANFNFGAYCSDLWKPLHKIGAHLIKDILNGNTLPNICLKRITSIEDVYMRFAEKYNLEVVPDCEDLSTHFNSNFIGDACI